MLDMQMQTVSDMAAIFKWPLKACFDIANVTSYCNQVNLEVPIDKTNVREKIVGENV